MAVKSIVLATRNQGKIKELQKLLAPVAKDVLTIDDFDNVPTVIEDGNTFEYNALKKAREIAAYTNCLALADDSGLQVDALEGKPGVHSARYAGLGATDADNNAKLLAEMNDIETDSRTARFKSVIALAWPDGRTHIESGVCEGIILETSKGHGGFGYDPLFYVPSYNKTYAEMTAIEKNKCSHRAIAFEKIKQFLMRGDY